MGKLNYLPSLRFHINTWCWFIVVVLLCDCPRRWPSIKSTMGQSFCLWPVWLQAKHALRAIPANWRRCPMLVYCWFSVCDAGPALNQHWDNKSSYVFSPAGTSSFHTPARRHQLSRSLSPFIAHLSHWTLEIRYLRPSFPPQSHGHSLATLWLTTCSYTYG